MLLPNVLIARHVKLHECHKRLVDSGDLCFCPYGWWITVKGSHGTTYVVRHPLAEELDRIIEKKRAVIHGVECHEAWRDYQDCPHEAAEKAKV